MSDLLKTENVTITLMPDGGHITAIHSCDATDDMEEFIVQQSIANKILRTRLEEAKRINAELMTEASGVAVYLWENNYKDESPDFKLLDDVSGVISQIDNMSCGLVRRQSLAEIQAAAIDGYSENMRGIMSESAIKGEAGMSMMCSFAIKTAAIHAADLRANASTDSDKEGG